MRVEVDLSICSGHARCQARSPEIYSTDDTLGKCIILLPEIPEELKESAIRGARSCPERAIKIIDD
jgi:ferredoxin